MTLLVINMKISDATVSKTGVDKFLIDKVRFLLLGNITDKTN